MQFSSEVQILSFLLRQYQRTTCKSAVLFHGMSTKFNPELLIPTTAMKQQNEDETGEIIFFLKAV